MKSRKLLAAVGAALGLALASGPAAAAVTYYFPFTVFQDDDIEFVFDNNGNGNIDVGDRLIAVGEVPETQGILAGQGPTSVLPHELTFVSDVTVAAIGAGGSLIMAPSGAAGLLAGFAAGTTIAAFLDATPDLNVIAGTCGTQAQCEALAGLGLTDGSVLYATFGFADPDDVWVGSAPGGTIAQVQAGGAASKFATFNFSQSVIVNNTGRVLLDQPCAPFCGIGVGADGLVDITGSGDFLGGAGLNAADWNARSDADLQLAIPEPGALALVGLALAAMGALRRRKKFIR
jgi:hypothetical protein